MSRASNGLALQRAELYGKPHLGCHYPDKRTKLGRLDDDAICQVCGSMATNAHHMVPKGMGGGSATMHHRMGGTDLRSPLIAVCGMGNATGCHRLFHAHVLSIRWEWYEPRYADWWWAGHFFMRHEPHAPELFAFGHYILTTRDGEECIDETR